MAAAAVGSLDSAVVMMPCEADRLQDGPADVEPQIQKHSLGSLEGSAGEPGLAQ